MTDTGMRELGFMIEEMESRGARLDEALRKLAGRRFGFKSGDGQVKIALDGDGNLLSLEIADELARSARPQVIGPQIVETLAKGRAAIDSLKQEMVRRAFGTDDDERAGSVRR